MPPPRQCPSTRATVIASSVAQLRERAVEGEQHPVDLVGGVVLHRDAGRERLLASAADEDELELAVGGEVGEAASSAASRSRSRMLSGGRPKMSVAARPSRSTTQQVRSSSSSQGSARERGVAALGERRRRPRQEILEQPAVERHGRRGSRDATGPKRATSPDPTRRSPRSCRPAPTASCDEPAAEALRPPGGGGC